MLCRPATSAFVQFGLTWHFDLLRPQPFMRVVCLLPYRWVLGMDPMDTTHVEGSPPT